MSSLSWTGRGVGGLFGGLRGEGEQGFPSCGAEDGVAGLQR